VELVAVRGALMQQMPRGSMLAVRMSEEQVREKLSGGLSLAAVNGARQCTVSGDSGEVGEWQKRREEEGIACQRLKTSHAYHSAMMEGMAAEYRREVEKRNRGGLLLPYISNVSGGWIQEDQARSADYWVRHMREPVRFCDGLKHVMADGERVMLEVGPGQTLSLLARDLAKNRNGVTVVSCLGGEGKTAEATTGESEERTRTEQAGMIAGLGRLWVAGVDIDWGSYYGEEKRKRIPLPVYPFERQRYWVEREGEELSAGGAAQEKEKEKEGGIGKQEAGQWLYVPVWRESAPVNRKGKEEIEGQGSWLLLLDEMGIVEKIGEDLRREGARVVEVEKGERWEAKGGERYGMRVGEAGDYRALLEAVEETGGRVERIVHGWSLTGEAEGGKEGKAGKAGEGKDAVGWRETEEEVEKAKGEGFYSLMYLLQAMGEAAWGQRVRVEVVCNEAQEVVEGEGVKAGKATMLGICRVAPQEYPNLECRVIDVRPGGGARGRARLLASLQAELSSGAVEPLVAYRGRRRWIQSFEHLNVDTEEGQPWRLRERGVYWITGGTGRIGLLMADYLSQKMKARIVLTGRSWFPEREDWGRWRQEHSEDDEISVKISQLEKIERQGGEVLVCPGDVADEGQMRAVLAAIQLRFGALHGVIHAAGNVDDPSFSAIQEMTVESCERQFRPKASGQMVMARILKNHSLDFSISFSSISTILGGLALAAYSGANHFLDAFAHATDSTDSRWLSINWDAWQLRPANSDGASSRGFRQQTLALLPGEGIEQFDRILGNRGIPVPRIVVSTGSLEQRLEQWVRLSSSTSDELTFSDLLAHERPDLSVPFAPPETNIESQLCLIWQQVLGVATVGLDDNFFELGGDSLNAITLCKRTNEVLGVTLPLNSILAKPTVRGLAGEVDNLLRVHDDAPAAHSILEPIRLQAGRTNRRPLLVIHPADGSLFHYHDLARGLGEDQPVYGFQAFGMGKNEEPLLSVEEMASKYMPGLRAVQPRGPYVLAGFCIGGMIAYEMGKRLQAMGEEVHLVAVLDTQGPGDTAIEPEDDAALLCFIFHFLNLSVEELREMDTEGQLNHILAKLEVTFPDLMTVFGDGQLRRLLNIYKINTRAITNYAPPTGTDLPRVVFFAARQRHDWEPQHSEQCWRRVIGDRLEVRSVPGYHRHMMSMPSVGVIIDYLKPFFSDPGPGAAELDVALKGEGN
jgi:thioesterase domain-containing protein/malonyl CoA-acyl carrier protein transacylase